MPGYLSLILHAHLPFVRHPEHERALEENWLFEALTESYIPILQLLERWQNDHIKAPLTLSLTPTLCSMLGDALLQRRYARYLEQLIELAENEIRRTHLEPGTQTLAVFYRERLHATRSFYQNCKDDLIALFRQHFEAGVVEIMAGPATHAVLPLLGHKPSVRAQILVGRDCFVQCFGRAPRGIWLPECAYSEDLEPALQEAGLRWFILDSHGLLRARPQPRYALFAPIFTPRGLAAFARDPESAKQVWSRHEGYPGDPRYRDFYRDIGYDLEYDYVRPYFAAPDRSFTGIKYHRITGPGPEKQIYQRPAALDAAAEHAQHFLAARVAQIQRVEAIIKRPPLLVSPYDAELFGHWWFEGPEFLDSLVRKIPRDASSLSLLTAEEYLQRHPTNQVATPSPSSWGENGYWSVWLNDKNQWIYPHLHAAQDRMTDLVNRFPDPTELERRALKQAGRELLLAQSSDWPFILRTGTSPEYARRRVTIHLARFTTLREQLLSAQTDEASLAETEAQDNLFPDLDYRYWASPP
jgi:1,4-alpha-glucan branching enzyme